MRSCAPNIVRPRRARKFGPVAAGAAAQLVLRPISNIFFDASALTTIFFSGATRRPDPNILGALVRRPAPRAEIIKSGPSQPRTYDLTTIVGGRARHSLTCNGRAVDRRAQLGLLAHAARRLRRSGNPDTRRQYPRRHAPRWGTGERHGGGGGRGRFVHCLLYIYTRDCRLF